MKKLLALVAGVVLTISINTIVLADETAPWNMDVSTLKLQWSDEFEGDTLNTDNWDYCIGNNGDNGNLWRWGNNELQYYTNSEENVKVSDGTLKLTAKSESIGGCKYSSGRIKSAGKVEVGYGYVEAKIKLPSINGLWPAFWMLGAGEPKGWPYCGEIDILESWNTGDFAQNCIHFADAEGNDDWSNYTKKGGIKKTEWHTYGVYKTKDYLVFYYDGARASKVIDITDPVKSEMHNNYYILLNLACGGTLTNNTAPVAADLPGTMEVDYVRYYREKTEEERKAEETSAPETSTKAEETTSAKEKSIPKVTFKSVKNVKKKKIKISIKKIADVNGYQIYYSANSKYKGKRRKNIKTTKTTLKGLKKKKTYWIKARAYKIVDGKKQYGIWSVSKKVKIKK